MNDVITIAKTDLLSKINNLEERKHRMVDYMQLKISEQDWHGVADAAMDIRDIEAALEALKEIK